MRANSYLTHRVLGLIILSIILYSSAGAQDDIKGLWVVEKVVVGEEIMTPVAKWFDIDGEGKISSGNGWLQHSNGTYDWEHKKMELQIQDSLGLADPFGAFKVELNEDSMYWIREEAGDLIRVYAVRSDELPMAPQDYLVGMWELTNASKDSSRLADHIYFRWDRNIRAWKDGKRSPGLWNFEAHRPVLLTIVGGNQYRWKTEVDTKKLLLEGVSEGNKDIKLEFVRIDHFPN